MVLTLYIPTNTTTNPQKRDAGEASPRAVRDDAMEDERVRTPPAGEGRDVSPRPSVASPRRPPVASPKPEAKPQQPKEVREVATQTSDLHDTRAMYVNTVEANKIAASYPTESLQDSSIMPNTSQLHDDSPPPSASHTEAVTTAEAPQASGPLREDQRADAKGPAMVPAPSKPKPSVMIVSASSCAS